MKIISINVNCSQYRAPDINKLDEGIESGSRFTIETLEYLVSDQASYSVFLSLISRSRQFYLSSFRIN